MNLITSIVLAASLSFASGAAFAACPDTPASATDTNKTGAISKDGTHAPLETPDAQAKAPGSPVAKDGNTMPLAGQENGGNKNLATSQQDVEAQQHGDKTAAATADENNCKD
jgi:hypothetical protein